MNRLSPLITRRIGPTVTAVPVDRWAPQWQQDDERQHALFEDLKLFATGWVGGLIFFGTLFG